MTDSSNGTWRPTGGLSDVGSPGSGSPYTQSPPPPPAMSRSERLHGGGTHKQQGQESGADAGGSDGMEGSADGPKKNWGKRIGLGILFTFLGLIILGAGAFIWIYNRTTIPEPTEFALAQTTTVYFSDGETEMGKFAEVNRTIIDIDTLPSYVPEAVVASEDRTFYTNAGVDLKGIARAFLNNVRGGDLQGASTLTQQYVENYFGRETYGYKDKLKEAFTALKINREQSKETVLSNYLNTIYFGRGSYGIEAASQAYFGIPAEDLTLSEAAMIAGIIPSPSNWDPAVNPEMAQERWARVLNLMVEDGWISQSEADAQIFPETIPPAQAENSMTGWKGYLLQQVRDELTEQGTFTAQDLDEGGLSIISTIDFQAQQDALEAVTMTMPEDTPDSVRVALSTVDNETGEIVAEYGGADYQEIQINAATQDIAMAGSTFKPFALIPFLEEGGSMTDRFNGNTPLETQGLTVNNNAGVSYGSVTANEAVKYSINTAFVEINEVVGAQNTMDTLIDAGIPEDTPGLEPTLLNVLGFASPHNIDITHAYSTLANGGERITPHIVREILDSRGNQVYQAVAPRESVFSATTISAMLPALESVPANMNRGSTGTLLGGHKVAGKTGTSEDFKSAGFAAFIPQVTTTVTMYNVGPDGEALELPMIGGRTTFYGGDWPADVWFAFMERLTADMPVEDYAWFDSSVVVKEIPQSGTSTSTQTPTTNEPEPEPAPEPAPEPDQPDEPEQSGGRADRPGGDGQ